MFVMTMTKRKLLRAIMFLLVLITGIAIGVFAILSAIDTGAASEKLPIYCVSRNDNMISLTFDCAWGNSNTDELIAILDEAKVKATFFVTGEFADKYPDDVKKLFDAGHEIQNHSDAHPHIKGMNINDLIADTKECNKKIKMITGTEPKLYRAPYGEYDDNSLTTLEGMGMRVIQWNVDSIDWDKPTPETIIERTTKDIQSGSVLLFHNDLDNTTEALPQVLKSLKEQGFEFCPVSELILYEDFTIDLSGMQIPLEKNISTIVYSENTMVNSAFAALAQSLTREEVDRLAAEGMSIEMAQITADILTDEQIAALQTQSYEQLLASFKKLKTAVYSRTENEGEQTEPILDSTPPQTTTQQSETTAPDKDGGAPLTSEAKATTVPDKDGGAVQTSVTQSSPAPVQTDIPDSTVASE